MDKQQQREQLLKANTPYGTALAQKVAERLRKGGSIGYGHRDYCGMGLQMEKGLFCYGELNDGYMDITRTFNTEETFVAWLAAQSDASLARLEEEHEFYWGNQTITQKRLEEFVVR